MSREDAIRALDDPANEQISWALGDLLRLRAARADWLQCRLLQQLETAQHLDAWRGLIGDTRRSLATEGDLPQKARLLLRPESTSFDQSLDDFVAEMVAAIYLSHLGHTGIRFPSEQDEITTDIISVHEGTTCVTEAKNLREPNSLAYVAFARWHQDSAADPQRYNFTAELVKIDDPFGDLTAEQSNAVRHLIDELPDRARPSTFQITLPGDRSVRVRVSNDPGGLVHYAGGPFLVPAAVEDCQRAVFLKLLEPAFVRQGQVRFFFED